MLGILFLCDAPGLTSGGGFYIGPLSYRRTVFALALSCGALWCFAGFLEKRRLLRSRLCRAEVTAFGQKLLLRGFVDTGNLLRDPLTGCPVYLLSADTAAKLLGDRERRVCYPVPYRAVGGETGKLDGFLPEEVRIYPDLKKEEEGHPVRAVLARAPGSLPEGCDILLALDAACIANER